MLGILSAGVAPGFALLSYFYLKDEFESEPISFVIRVFTIGALLVMPISFIQYVFAVENIIPSKILYTFLTVGFLEEFFKWFMLIYTVYHHLEFDEPYDGIVYGVSISLGFATVENIFYLIGNGLEYAISRALLPVSSHALFGVIMGYYLGKGKFAKENNKVWLVLSFVIPFLLHSIYDTILISFENWLFYIVPFMIFLWWIGLRKAKHAHHLSRERYMKINQYTQMNREI